MKFILKIVFSALVAFVLARYLPGVHIDSYWTAILFSLVLTLLNFFVKPLLILFTLPATILTLGLFLFIINAVVIWMASGMVEGFVIDGFWPALLFSILYSLITSILFSGTRKQAS